MEKVIKYRCNECGELFDTPEQCLNHEIRHKRIDEANEMLQSGYTLKEIQDKCNIWDAVPEHLKNVTKDNCFTISYWQCCNKPAYKIIYIYFDGRVKVRGCGSWHGYYGEALSLNDSDLNDPRPKEELYVSREYLENKYRR